MSMSNYTQALRRHLFRAKIAAYSLVLIVGGAQIVVREWFPALNPPWPIIGGGLIVIALGVVFVPPVFAARRADAPAKECGIRDE
jgi:hypothetical protein